MASSANLDLGAQLIVEECTTSYSLSPMPDIKVEHQLDSSTEEGSAQSIAMGTKFILPNRFDMNVCSRFVKSLNEEDSKNIQDQVNSDLEVASVLFKGWILLFRLLYVYCVFLVSLYLKKNNSFIYVFISNSFLRFVSLRFLLYVWWIINIKLIYQIIS